MMTMRVPISDRILRSQSDRPVLLASRCRDCGDHVFPVQDGCPRCTSDASEVVELASRGTLWTWTIQGFPPKAPPFLGDTSPEGFRPFGVGYVELPGQLKVETRLTVADPERLRIGMEMELVYEVIGEDTEGNEIVTYAFAPTGEEDQR
jgi:uncharacterized protein